MQITDGTGERWLQAELHRLKGQLLLRRGHAEAAENHYCEALRIAQEQEAKLWELRTATSLARLRSDQGRRADRAAESRRRATGFRGRLPVLAGGRGGAAGRRAPRGGAGY